MASNGLTSPTTNGRKLTSSFFASPRLFTGFSPTETDAVMSPTSILDSKPFSGLKNSFWSEANSPRTTQPAESKRPWDSRGVGLGIVDSLSDENSDPKPTRPETRMVLLGSQLKIQIPPLPPFISPGESPKSPVEFGIKTKKSAFGSSSSGLGTPNSPHVFTAGEMELSEDYTCVISHGPNPRTTHIFGDLVIESSCGFFSPSRKENFLSFCHGCKKNLEQGKDIYMYRGEKAFCSDECRYQEMMLEEGIDEFESDRL